VPADGLQKAALFLSDAAEEPGAQRSEVREDHGRFLALHPAACSRDARSLVGCLVFCLHAGRRRPRARKTSVAQRDAE
jgi:hypothetical protein